MPEHDDSLEVNLAAGLDIPTALVLSDRTDVEQPTKEKGWGRLVAVALIAGAVAVAIVWLRR